VNALKQKYGKEIEKILKKYPEGHQHSAVMPLIYMAQREDGYVTKQNMINIGEILDMTTTEVAAIVGFYTLYHDKPGGKIRIQVCNDLPCALKGADEFLEKLCENLGIEVGETTEDGLVTVEGVMCLAGCDHAPLFQVQSQDGISYHEDQTVESAMELVEKLRKESGGK
jgi:NADH-quinone oxidoreductase subunit E